MDRVSPANYLCLALIGAALLWAVRLVYGTRRVVGDDALQRALLLAGWLLLIGGVIGTMLGLTGPVAVFPILGLVLCAGAYFQYMTAERRALLWALAVAAEKGLPLAQAARALAEERPLQIGLRAAALADLLEAGAPLPQALVLARHPLPTDLLLAVRMGHQTGRLGPALRMALEHSDHFAGIMRNVLAKYFYLLLVLGVGLVSTTFIALKIVPVFERMFQEFGLELPALTKLVFAVMNWSFRLGPLFVVPYLLFLLLLVLGLSYYAGWSRYEMPLFHRLWLRRDAALVLQALALAVREQRDLAATLQMLAKQYPKASVGRRLDRAAAAVARGVPWCAALGAEELLGPAEAAVLRSAERVGNLGWALEEMADSSLRRFALRWRMVLGLVYPVGVLLLAVAVAALVAGMFMPLVCMVQGLS